MPRKHEEENVSYIPSDGHTSVSYILCQGKCIPEYTIHVVLGILLYPLLEHSKCFSSLAAEHGITRNQVLSPVASSCRTP